jgi:hypothetical protein
MMHIAVKHVKVQEKRRTTLMFAYYRHSLEIKDIKKIEKNGKT